MEQALDALKAEEKPNFKKTAEVFGVNRTTLMMRFKSQRVSREEYISTHRKILTNAQEDELLYHIDQLTLRGLPPTPEMLKNLVEEITKQPIGERLIWRFRQHHANRIDSLQTRKVADNSKYFEHFIEENIKSAFESTGIHLIDSQKVLSQVGRRTPSPISSDREPEETTPMSVRGVRRAVKAVGREHKVLDPKISKLIKAAEKGLLFGMEFLNITTEISTKHCVLRKKAENEESLWVLSTKTRITQEKPSLLSIKSGLCSATRSRN